MQGFWSVFDIAGKKKEIQELEQQAGQPSFWANPDQAQRAMQRLATLKKEVEAWEPLERRLSDLLELVQMALQEGDRSLEEQLRAEARDLARQLEEAEFHLTLSGPYDQRDAILSIHAGAGGTESQDWAEMLLRMYLRWAERKGFQAQVLDLSPGDVAGIKSATLEIRAPYAYGYLKGEKGVHRLVRLSPFDADHLRHTSFALVEVLPAAEENVDITISPDDLKVDFFRASGHGGQNVQKVSSAVRITHIPTGIVVTCQQERSQRQNREYAMRILTARLMERELEQRAKEQAELKGEFVPASWGNQIRSYVLHPYQLVKDHRTGFETSNTQGVLDGDLDELLKAYLASTIGQR